MTIVWLYTRAIDKRMTTASSAVTSRTQHCRNSPLLRWIFQGQHLCFYISSVAKSFFSLINTCPPHVFLKYDIIQNISCIRPKNALESGFSFTVSIHTKLMEYKIGILLFLSFKHFCCSNLTKYWSDRIDRYYGVWLALVCELNHYNTTTNTLKAESARSLNFRGIKLYFTISIYYNLKPRISGFWRRKVVFRMVCTHNFEKGPALSNPSPILKATSHKPSFTFKAKTFLSKKYVLVAFRNLGSVFSSSLYHLLGTRLRVAEGEKWWGRMEVLCCSSSTTLTNLWDFADVKQSAPSRPDNSSSTPSCSNYSKCWH